MEKHPEAYYNLIDDFDLIIASFQQQYKIRLSRELKGMKASEFFALLKGLNEKTPLGRIVSIRAENDKEILKNFSKYERDIRNEWRKKMANNIKEEDMQNILENLKQAFISMAGGEEDKKSYM